MPLECLCKTVDNIPRSSVLDSDSIAIESCMLSLITGFVSRGSLLHTFSPGKLSWHLLPGNDFGVKKVYKSPKSIHRADAKGLTSSSKLSVSCVLTLQTLPLITFTPSYALRAYTFPSLGLLSLEERKRERDKKATPEGNGRME